MRLLSLNRIDGRSANLQDVAIKKHLLIYLSELKQNLEQDTNVLSHLPMIQKVADITLTRTNTLTTKVIIEIQRFHTMLLAATTVKIKYVIFWIFQQTAKQNCRTS